MTLESAALALVEPLDSLPAPMAAHTRAADAYLAGLAPGSRRTMARALAVVAEIATGGKLDPISMPWHTLTAAHTAAIREQLAERYAPATANLHLAALRGVLKSAWRLGAMGADQRERAADVGSVRGSRLQAGRALAAGEVLALFGVCKADATAAGARDGALFGLLYGAGLRCAEVVGLDLESLDLENADLVVIGKGNKQRRAHLDAGALRAVRAWLAFRGDAPGPLLCPVAKGGKVELRRMTTRAVALVCEKRLKAAGIADFSPHDLRRSFISDLLDRGADVAHVQQLAGHASPTTTSRYDRRPEAARKRTASLISVPW